MYDAEDVVVWVERDTKQIHLDEARHFRRYEHKGHWCDPIGAHYSEWRKMTDGKRVQLMVETAIDLAMQGFDLGYVLRAFAQVRQFRKLGGESYPMCRALTSALLGQCLESNTMTFEELLQHYKPQEAMNG